MNKHIKAILSFSLQPSSEFLLKALLSCVYICPPAFPLFTTLTDSCRGLSGCRFTPDEGVNKRSAHILPDLPLHGANSGRHSITSWCLCEGDELRHETQMVVAHVCVCVVDFLHLHCLVKCLVDHVMFPCLFSC